MDDAFREENERFDEIHKKFFSGNTLSVEGEELEFGTYSPAVSPDTSLFRAEIECSSGTIRVHPVSIEKNRRQISIEYLSESEDGGWGQTETVGKRHDPLPPSSVGYAVYVSYDTMASWETWLASVSNNYSPALACAVWLTHSPGGNSIEDMYKAFTGASHDPVTAERDQSDILTCFGSMGEQCAITGDTDKLKRVTLPYYILPYLNNDKDEPLEAYTGVPYFPFVIPVLKMRVSAHLIDTHECLRESPRLKRRNAGVYAFDEDLREFATDINLSEVEVSYSNWI